VLFFFCLHTGQSHRSHFGCLRVVLIDSSKFGLKVALTDNSLEVCSSEFGRAQWFQAWLQIEGIVAKEHGHNYKKLSHSDVSMCHTICAATKATQFIAPHMGHSLMLLSVALQQ